MELKENIDQNYENGFVTFGSVDLFRQDAGGQRYPRTFDMTSFQ